MSVRILVETSGFVSRCPGSSPQTLAYTVRIPLLRCLSLLWNSGVLVLSQGDPDFARPGLLCRNLGSGVRRIPNPETTPNTSSNSRAWQRMSGTLKVRVFICLSGRSQFPASERDSASRWEETLKAVAGTVTRKLDSPASFEFDAFFRGSGYCFRDL